MRGEGVRDNWGEGEGRLSLDGKQSVAIILKS